MTATWAAPVRYAEADQQGVVFNSHYLLYCDETMGAYLAQADLDAFVHLIRLKRSTLTWHASAVFGDTVEVDAHCTGVGRTSFTMEFEVRVGDRVCCAVETVYVLTDPAGVPVAITDADRGKLVG